MFKMSETANDLSERFDKGFELNEELKETSLPTNSKPFQDKVNDGIKLLEESTQMVNELSLFSRNESVEEITTNDLKYLLLPAILADLTLKSNITERSEILRTAEIYFHDFIQRLNDYQICDIQINRSDNESTDDKSRPTLALSSNMESLETAARNRNDKIKRYRNGKELDSKLKQFKQQMSETKGSVDEQLVREYYLTLLKRWVNHSLDELNSIETEKPVLEHMKQMKSLNKEEVKDRTFKSIKQSSLKPIIITRNELQKKIYGLGYPSIPTVSVDQFIDKKLEEGSLAITDQSIYNNNLIDWAENPDQKLKEDEEEEERKERLVETDDLDKLRRDRNWDDWKDDHKRGEGNRKNMG